MTYALWRFLCPLLLVAAIWYPELTHYQVDRSSMGAELLERLAVTPDDSVLTQVGQIDLAELDGSPPLNDGSVDEILSGRFQVPGREGRAIALRGYPMDYLSGPPSFRLFMASLGIENLLLREHARSHDERALLLALDRAVQLAEHERRQWHETSFLWNDHAIANRVSVLVELWKRIRGRPGLRQQYGPHLLAFALRSGRLLAKPSQFTVRTNHGVMQNIALLQLAAAFPLIPEASEWQKLAHERVRLQLGFYVSPEGVVLEHSAGYHAMGSRLLGYVQLLLSLNHAAPDRTLDDAIVASSKVLATISRPDGSLPFIGNTSSRVKGLARAPVDAPIYDLWEAAGWAVWRSPAGDGESHAMITWAKHDGHGHKRPDEGSLHFWVDGVDWITASGYWPYGHGQFADAYSWLAANAPHVPGESGRSARTVRLESHGASADARFLEIVRQLAGGGRFSRQVLQLGPSSILVLDFVEDGARGIEVLWTMAPELVLSPEGPGRYSLTSGRTDRAMSLVVYSSSPQTSVSALRGSTTPFGGWVVLGDQPAPAPSVHIVSRDSTSVTATFFSVTPRRTPIQLGPLSVATSSTAAMWTAKTTMAGVPIQVTRDGATVRIARDDKEASLLRLRPSDDTAARAIDVLRGNFREAVHRYPPWRDLWRYRERVTAAILLAMAILEISFGVLRWRFPSLSRRTAAPATAVVTGIWVVAAIWLMLVYFKV